MGLDWTLASDKAGPSAAADRARCCAMLPAFERPLQFGVAIVRRATRRAGAQTVDEDGQYSFAVAL
jgi:hypothetical protein